MIAAQSGRAISGPAVGCCGDLPWVRLTGAGVSAETNQHKAPRVRWSVNGDPRQRLADSMFVGVGGRCLEGDAWRVISAA